MKWGRGRRDYKVQVKQQQGHCESLRGNKWWPRFKEAHSSACHLPWAAWQHLLEVPLIKLYVCILGLRSYKLSDVVSEQCFSAQKSWIVSSPLPPQEELSPKPPQVIHCSGRIHPEASSENYGS